MVESSQLLPNFSPRGFVGLTYLLSVDEVLIFYRGTVRNLKGIMQAFDVYGGLSSQLVNWSKSSIIFGLSVSHAQIGRLQSLVGMQIGMLSISNMGVLPLSNGGLGLKDLGLLNDSLLKKFTWKLMTSEALLFHFYGNIILSISVNHIVVSGANRLGIGWIRNCVNDLLMLRCFGLCGRPTKTPVFKSVIWSPPTPGWIKVNMDGAALSSLGTGGCGGVFRNCRFFVKGVFLSLLVRYLHLRLSCLLLLWALILLGSTSGVGFGWRVIPSYVVQLFSSSSENVPWQVRRAWQRCIFQISQIEFQVSHIFKEGNQVTDALSKHALGLEVDSWWFFALSFCSSLVDNDCISRESFRFS
ncbi:hypothetical protein Dsin_001693 [Dipteronia sinensis]|uniref:RNase H type-1 domain-containing protein n=1 Tax=Dipteronia sinensis TaxID=43782 RepID=A0AAE0B5S3_9ROSI|nr:hypothetical protein Dsin_001693 [Dipteronia sinensis]